MRRISQTPLIVHPRTNARHHHHHQRQPHHRSSILLGVLSSPQVHVHPIERLRLRTHAATMSPAHESARAPPARPSRGHQPSFSAALLDAIYQSLEADADARPSTETRPAPASPPQRTPVSSRHSHRAASAVSSPSRSSVRSPRLQMPPRPCRVRPDPQPNSLLLPPPPLPPPSHDPTGDRADQKKKSRKSKRDAKKTRVAPFACILNALLCNRRSATRSAEQHTPRAAAAAFPATEPASARSILSSRASRRESAATGGILTPARRAVRFSPVAVVVDDERGGGAIVGTATRLRDAVEVETMVQAKESAAEAERRVEELLRALGVAEERERERAKESSESSSDLFELESLPPALDGAEPPRPRASAAAGLLARPRPRVA